MEAGEVGEVGEAGTESVFACPTLPVWLGHSCPPGGQVRALNETQIQDRGGLLCSETFLQFRESRHHVFINAIRFFMQVRDLEFSFDVYLIFNV